jgi:hypothetical protein
MPDLVTQAATLWNSGLLCGRTAMAEHVGDRWIVTRDGVVITECRYLVSALIVLPVADGWDAADWAEWQVCGALPWPERDLDLDVLWEREQSRRRLTSRGFLSAE